MKRRYEFRVLLLPLVAFIASCGGGGGGGGGRAPDDSNTTWQSGVFLPEATFAAPLRRNDLDRSANTSGDQLDFRAQADLRRFVAFSWPEPLELAARLRRANGLEDGQAFGDPSTVRAHGIPGAIDQRPTLSSETSTTDASPVRLGMLHSTVMSLGCRLTRWRPTRWTGSAG